MQEGFRRKSPASRLKSGKGEIVQVQGGRILRSIGRKDRHSKVCTSRGPRDRRLRLSANTAIRFYDVQDRLGHGRPSEAIDWLMKEAKAAIDALDELPSTGRKPEQELEEKSYGEFSNQSQQHLDKEPINSLSSFFVPSSSSDFQNLPPAPEVNSRNRGQIHGFSPSFQLPQNPMLLQNHLSVISATEPTLFSASSALNFETTPINWTNPQLDGFAIDSLPQWLLRILGQDQVFSQGGTLQSSYSPSFRALVNPQLSDLNYDQMPEVNPSPATGNSFAGDGFSGFFVSPGVQEEEEEHNPVQNKPESATCL